MGVCFCMGQRTSSSKSKNSKQNINQLQNRHTVIVFKCNKPKTSEFDVSYIPNKISHTR